MCVNSGSSPMTDDRANNEIQPAASDVGERLGLVHADTPVSVDGDQLGRAHFASLIARQIEVTRSDRGLVMSLVGPWGSGKSSVLSMVAESFAGDPTVVVVNFNPWFFSGSDQLVALFFATLAEQLPERLGEGRGVQVAAHLRSYGQALGTLRALPLFGGFFGAGSDVLSEAAKRTDSSITDLPEQRRVVADELRDLGARVLVLIDDVDRLQPTEVRDLMRMVKLVGDLPSITYLLAFDPSPVEGALKSEGINGREYLEKIVQVEHRVPDPSAERLESMLVEVVQAAVGHIPEERFDAVRWRAVLVGILNPLVRTPRHIRRYANGLALGVSLAGDDVNIVDVLALTGLATFLPTFHARLPLLAEDLTGVSRSLMFTSKPEQERAAARLRAAAKESGRPEVVLAAYELLFPHTGRLLDEIHPSHSESSELARLRRVANPEAFTTYLTAVIPEDGVSAAETAKVLDAFRETDVLQDELRSRDVADLSRIFRRLIAHAQEIPLARVPDSVRVIAPIAREAKGAPSPFISTPEDWMNSFLVSLLSRLDGEARSSFIASWFGEEADLTGMLAVFRIARRNGITGEPLVSEEAVEAMQGAIADKVLSVDAGELMALDDVGRLLWLSGDFLRRTRLGEFHHLLENDQVFARYLFAFTEPPLGQGPRPLGWDGVAQALGHDWLVDRVSSVSATDLNTEMAEVVETARGFVERERADESPPSAIT